MVDDFRQSHPPTKRPGPKASECYFYRYASGHLREVFPTLPERSQFNRSVLFHTQGSYQKRGSL